MKQIWKGKLRIRIKRENPYYVTAGRHLEKVLFCRWGLSISLWTVHPDSPLGEFSDWAKAKLMRMFPGCRIEGHIVYYDRRTFYPGDYKWIFGYDLKPTENPQVFFDVKANKYIGFSHRGYAAFGVGDTLFSPNTEGSSFITVRRNIEDGIFGHYGSIISIGMCLRFKICVKITSLATVL